MTVPPGSPGCCQFADADCGAVCNGGFLPCPTTPPLGMFISFSEGKTCDEVTGQCGFEARNVPTLSEWGLLAMAGIMGIIAYLLLRRKKLRHKTHKLLKSNS